MGYRTRIYYTEEQKALMWDRWQRGDSLATIARLFDRGHSSVQRILQETGGIRPPQRRRSRLSLTLSEREEISRRVVAGGYCQLNDIQTALPIDGFIPLLFGHDLGARHLMPFTECPRAKLAIVNRSRQMPTQSEQIAYNAINGEKALRLAS